MDGAAAQVLDGANNFEETQSKFPNLRETRSKLGKVKGAVPVCGGGCSFLEKQHIIQKMKPNHHIVKMVQYDQKYWNQKDLTSNHLTLRAQSGITLRNHSEITQTLLKDHSEITQDTTQVWLRERSKNTRRTCRERDVAISAFVWRIAAFVSSNCRLSVSTTATWSYYKKGDQRKSKSFRHVEPFPRAT